MHRQAQEWRLIVVGDPDLGQLGGTHLVNRAVLAASPTERFRQILTEDEALSQLESSDSHQPTLVFTIQEGYLSREYAEWAHSCLRLGATIIENNVFNLPSRFRPTHPRYLIAFNTNEGAQRYAIRSWVFRRSRGYSYFACQSVVHASKRHTAALAWNGEISFLRVGRPDPVKWSDWEVRFANDFAVKNPDRRVTLTLLGAPESLHLPSDLSRNLEVIRKSNVSDISAEYAIHNCYLHYSSIGETYGNTLAEAQNSGLFVICALDTRWDCAPMTFLDPTRSVIGTRMWLRDHSHEIGKVIDEAFAERLQTEAITSVGLNGGQYRANLLEAAEGAVLRLPSVTSGVQELRRQVRAINGVKFGLTAPAVELLRGLRLRVKS